MADPRREGENSRTEGTNPEGSVPGGNEQPRRDGSNQGTETGRQSKTAGTNRDFDESGEGKNQGHGHPREERGQTP